jgi:hypothetical protein
MLHLLFQFGLPVSAQAWRMSVYGVRSVDARAPVTTKN